jgi:hypothetical protein
MKTTILSISALAFAILAFNINVSAQAKAKAPKDKILVNKVYTVEMTETTNQKVGKKANDEISFKSEKLNSKFMTSENKFPAALYTVTVDSTTTPPTISFVSEGNSDGEDIKWEGTITGDDIEGTATISKKGKTKKEYAYTGSIKVKGAKK